MNTLVIDIGGTKFTVGAFNDGSLRLRESFAINREGGPEAMIGTIADTLKRWADISSFRAERCGIGFGGPVDFRSQRVVLSTHVAGWNDFPLLERISEVAGCQAVMDNDANVGALGEAHHGAARGLESSFYMTVSTGIGGGFLWNGRVLHGPDSFAGEIGHVNVLPDGPECLCGSNGCLERMCCGFWLERDHGRAASELLQEPEFVRRYVVYLARGLKAVFMILNPGAVVIGGGISKAGPALLGPLQEEVERQMPPWSRARRTILQSELGDDSVLFGAAVLAESTA